MSTKVVRLMVKTDSPPIYSKLTAHYHRVTEWGYKEMRTHGGKHGELNISDVHNRIHPPPPKPGSMVSHSLGLVARQKFNAAIIKSAFER